MIAEVAIKKERKKRKQPINKVHTLEEYFLLEEKSVCKNEFVNGKIVEMAGGTFNHSMLSGTIYALLFMLFFNSDEEVLVLSNDQKIYIPDHHRSVYPDTSVVVGKKEMYNKGNQAVINPTLIVEVASKSIPKLREYDRSSKFRLYQSLPSFKEYVLVDQEMPIVDVFFKVADNKWQMTSYVGLDKVVSLETLGVTLKMADIYKKVTDLKDPQTAFDFVNEKEEKA